MTRVGAIARTVWLEMLRRKDAYVLLLFLAVMLFGLMSLDVFGISGDGGGAPAGYVKDFGLMFAWLFSWILAVSISARQLPEEEKRGTIYPLLAKPITRCELLAGKWLGAWSAAAGAALAFYGVVVGLAVAQGGSFGPGTLVQAYLLHAAALAVISALALAVSTRCHQDAALALSYVASGASFLLLPRMFNLLVYEKGVRGTALTVVYFLLPHLEFFDLRRRVVHDWGPAPPAAFAIVLAYGVAATLLFLLIACLGYRRKVFSRLNLE